ncbi:MAG: (2Fe-2S) ferredoxin domain-containing protein [Planctomycetota bacterium]|nr:(2Fe-2S) ferredoxin domain-containing protein [Planctomycetota bacterium]
MQRLSSIDGLAALRRRLRDDVDPGKPRVTVCGGTACRASGAGNIIQVAQGYLIQKGLLGRISFQTTGCHGFCEMGPFVLTEPHKAFYA